MIRNVVKSSLLLVMSAVLLVGCGKEEVKGEAAMNSNHTIQATTANKDKIESKIDHDLTQVSNEMMLALLYQFVVAPEEFGGQSIRMQGAYYSGTNEQTGDEEHYCVVNDATSCCAQGVEFVWDEVGQEALKNELVDEQEIIVTGVLETYEIENRTYMRIKNAVVEKKQ